MKFVPKGVTTAVATTLLKTRQSSPTILFAGGIAGVIVTTVLASRATLRLDEKLTDVNDKLAQISETDILANGVEYTDKDKKHDKAIVLIGAAVDITKLYGPAFLVGVASITMLAGSHNILTKRNAAVTAAYAALDKGFREYRARVVEDLGEEKDRFYLNDVKTHRHAHVDENGKKTIVETHKATATSAYGRVFDRSNPNWTDRHENVLIFIKSVENMLTQQLQANGFLFLNDALKDLGFERNVEEGAVVGWMVGNGDGYVDFGIWDDRNTVQALNFIHGREDEIYINFNVDGLIFGKKGGKNG